jgi:ferredoxin--NADP+ reductase
VETTDLLLADARAGALIRPTAPTAAAVERLLADRGVRVVSWADWLKIDELERRQGAATGRPRLKLTRIEDMLAVLETSDV